MNTVCGVMNTSCSLRRSSDIMWMCPMRPSASIKSFRTTRCKLQTCMNMKLGVAMPISGQVWRLRKSSTSGASCRLQLSIGSKTVLLRRSGSHRKDSMNRSTTDPGGKALKSNMLDQAPTDNPDFDEMFEAFKRLDNKSDRKPTGNEMPWRASDLDPEGVDVSYEDVLRAADASAQQAAAGEEVYGLPAVILAGFRVEEYAMVRTYLDAAGGQGIKVLPADQDTLYRFVDDAIQLPELDWTQPRPQGWLQGAAWGAQRCVIFSGMSLSAQATMLELLEGAGLPLLCCATASPANGNRRVGDVLAEAIKELRRSRTAKQNWLEEKLGGDVVQDKLPPVESLITARVQEQKQAAVEAMWAKQDAMETMARAQGSATPTGAGSPSHSNGSSNPTAGVVSAANGMYRQYAKEDDSINISSSSATGVVSAANGSPGHYTEEDDGINAGDDRNGNGSLGKSGNGTEGGVNIMSSRGSSSNSSVGNSKRSAEVDNAILSTSSSSSSSNSGSSSIGHSKRSAEVDDAIYSTRNSGRGSDADRQLSSVLQKGVDGDPDEYGLGDADMSSSFSQLGMATNGMTNDAEVDDSGLVTTVVSKATRGSTLGSTSISNVGAAGAVDVSNSELLGKGFGKEAVGKLLSEGQEPIFQEEDVTIEQLAALSEGLSPEVAEQWQSALRTLQELQDVERELGDREGDDELDEETQAELESAWEQLMERARAKAAAKEDDGAEGGRGGGGREEVDDTIMQWLGPRAQKTGTGRAGSEESDGQDPLERRVIEQLLQVKKMSSKQPPVGQQHQESGPSEREGVETPLGTELKQVQRQSDQPEQAERESMQTQPGHGVQQAQQPPQQQPNQTEQDQRESTQIRVGHGVRQAQQQQPHQREQAERESMQGQLGPEALAVQVDSQQLSRGVPAQSRVDHEQEVASAMADVISARGQATAEHVASQLSQREQVSHADIVTTQPLRDEENYNPVPSSSTTRTSSGVSKPWKRQKSNANVAATPGTAESTSSPMGMPVNDTSSSRVPANANVDIVEKMASPAAENDIDRAFELASSGESSEPTAMPAGLNVLDFTSKPTPMTESGNSMPEMRNPFSRISGRGLATASTAGGEKSDVGGRERTENESRRWGSGWKPAGKTKGKTGWRGGSFGSDVGFDNPIDEVLAGLDVDVPSANTTADGEPLRESSSGTWGQRNGAREREADDSAGLTGAPASLNARLTNGSNVDVDINTDGEPIRRNTQVGNTGKAWDRLQNASTSSPHPHEPTLNGAIETSNGIHDTQAQNVTQRAPGATDLGATGPGATAPGAVGLLDSLSAALQSGMSPEELKALIDRLAGSPSVTTDSTMPAALSAARAGDPAARPASSLDGTTSMSTQNHTADLPDSPVTLSSSSQSMTPVSTAPMPMATRASSSSLKMATSGSTTDLPVSTTSSSSGPETGPSGSAVGDAITSSSPVTSSSSARTESSTAVSSSAFTGVRTRPMTWSISNKPAVNSASKAAKTTLGRSKQGVSRRPRVNGTAPRTQNQPSSSPPSPPSAARSGSRGGSTSAAPRLQNEPTSSPSLSSPPRSGSESGSTSVAARIQNLPSSLSSSAPAPPTRSGSESGSTSAARKAYGPAPPPKPDANPLSMVNLRPEVDRALRGKARPGDPQVNFVDVSRLPRSMRQGVMNQVQRRVVGPQIIQGGQGLQASRGSAIVVPAGQDASRPVLDREEVQALVQAGMAEGLDVRRLLLEAEVKMGYRVPREVAAEFGVQL